MTLDFYQQNMGFPTFAKVTSNPDQVDSSSGFFYKSGYSIFSYFRERSGIAGSFTFNGSDSQSPMEGFSEPLSDLWLDALKVLMADAESEDMELMQGYKPVEYTRVFNFRGRGYKFLVSKFPFKTQDGNIGLAVTIRDVTFFLDSVDEFSIRKMLFSLVADNMSDVFCVFNMEGRPSFLSPSIEKLTGYTSAELIQLPPDQFLKPLSLLELKRIWNGYSCIFGKAEDKVHDISPVLFELEFVRKDQQTRWAEVSSAVFFDTNGKILGVHGIIRDITERKAEQASIHNSLQHEIELSMVKSKYISTISHEFRTPLSIIYSNLQLLENHRFQLDEETIGDAFGLSRMAVKSLLRVLDKVTVIDAVNKNKLEFRPSSVNLAVICNRIIKDLNEMEIYPDRIDLVIDSVQEEVWIDESLFSHIFTNLLHNALNFSDKKHRVRFEVSLVGPGRALFVISDKGIGIPEAEHQYIFESFYRASNSKNARGSGLGLAVVRECLRLHKGEISFESKSGAGSVFKIYLPIAPEV